MTAQRIAATVALALVLSGCESALPDVIDALPAEVGGVQRADRALDDDGRYAAALADAGVAPGVVAGHEVRWGDDLRLIVQRFENVGLNGPALAARSILGLADPQTAIGVLGTQTITALTSDEVEGVAYELALGGEGSETVMATIVAPSDDEARVIVDAIVDALPASP